MSHALSLSLPLSESGVVTRTRARSTMTRTSARATRGVGAEVPHPGVCGWFVPRPREGGTDAAMGDGDESLSLSLSFARVTSRETTLLALTGTFPDTPR